MVNSCKPNLFLIAIFFFLFSQIVPAADANANGQVSKVVGKFCKRNNIYTQKDFCIQVFRSDPRSATISDDVTLAKVGMELVTANLEKISSEFSQVQNPLLKPELDSCADNYRAVVKLFKLHFGLALSGEDEPEDLGSWNYDLYNHGDDITQCPAHVGSTALGNESLVKQSELAANYYKLGFRVTNLVIAKFFPRLAVSEN